MGVFSLSCLLSFRQIGIASSPLREAALKAFLILTVIETSPSVQRAFIVRGAKDRMARFLGPTAALTLTLIAGSAQDFGVCF